MASVKTAYTPIAEICFDESESILHIKVLEGAEMNLLNTQRHYQEINNLVGKKKYLALVDASNYFTMEKAAWEYASLKEIISNRIAVAHYNSSVANKLATKVFKAAYKTSMPVEVFQSKETALEWLISFRKSFKN